MSIIKLDPPKLITPSNVRAFNVVRFNEDPRKVAENPPLAFLWKSIAPYDDSAALKWLCPMHDDIDPKNCVVIPLYAHFNQDKCLLAVDYETLPYRKGSTNDKSNPEN